MSSILVATAYLPPVDYMAALAGAERIIIEKEENYIKQTFRNRCYILSPHGTQMLTVPVLEGSRHKVNIKEARIDYSKRWQQVHLRAIISSYKSSPYFDFYFENIEKIISDENEFLIDLNNKLLNAVMGMLKIRKEIAYSQQFTPPGKDPGDFRFLIDPGKPPATIQKRYLQVFDTGKGFVPRLSIMDLIFNTGPEAVHYLQ